LYCRFLRGEFALIERNAASHARSREASHFIVKAWG
jgi:hypothetical protein